MKRLTVVKKVTSCLQKDEGPWLLLRARLPIICIALNIVFQAPTEKPTKL